MLAEGNGDGFDRLGVAGCDLIPNLVCQLISGVSFLDILCVYTNALDLVDCGRG